MPSQQVVRLDRSFTLTCTDQYNPCYVGHGYVDEEDERRYSSGQGEGRDREELEALRDDANRTLVDSCGGIGIGVSGIWAMKEGEFSGAVDEERIGAERGMGGCSEHYCYVGFARERAARENGLLVCYADERDVTPLAFKSVFLFFLFQR